jgi:hypothetical protein
MLCDCALGIGISTRANPFSLTPISALSPKIRPLLPRFSLLSSPSDRQPPQYRAHACSGQERHHRVAGRQVHHSPGRQTDRSALREGERAAPGDWVCVMRMDGMRV